MGTLTMGAVPDLIATQAVGVEERLEAWVRAHAYRGVCGDWSPQGMTVCVDVTDADAPERYIGGLQQSGEFLEYDATRESIHTDDAGVVLAEYLILFI